jgi:hypothetical protein
MEVLKMITAHGKTYRTIEEAQKVWDMLEAINQTPGVGPSDGRVTEQNAIAAAIQRERQYEGLKFRPGDTIKARNGSYYQVSHVEEKWGQKYYYIENGAVHVGKIGLTGYWTIEDCERRFRLVKD